ncbi:MAG TPA: LysM domain-containing protein [Solirubrobacteraceae bacterium]
MIADAMVAKSARYLAPIALAAVAVATYLIVQSGLESHPRAASPPVGILSSGNGHHQSRRTPRFYVVKPGDTLSQISIKTHVSLFQITNLNPNLSPNSLQTGQRLRLRR